MPKKKTRKKRQKKKSGKSKKVPKKKKDKKNKKKTAVFCSQPCLEGSVTYFYSKDRLVQNHNLLSKVSLIHWHAKIFFQENTMSHKQKKKLVMAEGGGRSCVRNLCSKLCCFFLPSGWGVQRLRQRSAHSKGFPPLQKKRNTWQFLKVENKITCKRERKVLQPLQQKVRFKLTIWFQPWHHFY